jgi:hypothetical protein
MARRLFILQISLVLILFKTLLAGVSGIQASQPEIALLVNQAGYNKGGIKSIWLQADFDPADIRTFMVSKNDQVVFQGQWGAVNKIEAWNKWYRQGDLSSVSEPGEYRAYVEWQGRLFWSPPFTMDTRRLIEWTGPLAVEFFFVQRCGTEVPGWHAACHLDDARFLDGRHINLSGGWHDAGDYNKYNGYTPLAVYALAKFAESPSLASADFSQSPTTPLKEALWGAEWLQKCQDPETRKLIGYVFSGFKYWGIPEKETDNIPGNSDDRPAYPLDWNENEMAVAAYSTLFRITRDTAWKQAALDLWAVVKTHDCGQNPLQWAKRLLAAAELHKSFWDASLALEAEKCADVLLRTQDASGRWPVWSLLDNGLVPASLAEFILEFEQSRLVPDIRRSLEQNIAYWEKNRPIPFAIPKWNETDVFFPYLEKTWYVGQNSQYLSQAWAGLLFAQVSPSKQRQALKLAQGCLDWVLGANPFGICLMCGAGSLHLKRYHHRYDTIPNGRQGNVPGAISNGITREKPELDIPYLDLEGNSWQTNEPWLPHNAYYLLCLAEINISYLRAENGKAKKDVRRPGVSGYEKAKFKFFLPIIFPK